MTEMNRRNFFKSLGALVQVSQAPGGVMGWLDTLDASNLPTLPPDMAEMVAWEHLRRHGQLAAIMLHPAQPISPLLTQEQRSWIGEPTPDMKVGWLSKILLASARADEDMLTYHAHDGRVLPENADALCRQAKALLSEQAAWNRQAERVACFTSRYSHEVRDALQHIESHILEGKLSQHNGQGWENPWWDIDLFDASADEIKTFFSRLQRNEVSHIWKRVAQCIGLEHVDASKLTADDLTEVQKVLADPNWHSIYDRRATAKQAVQEDLETHPLDGKRTLVITTGGTIESQYNPEEGTPYHVPLPDKAADSCIPDALRQLGADGDCDFYRMTMVDSKKMTSANVDHLLAYVAEHHEEYDRIVIVHGTDTSAINAKKIKDRITGMGAYAGAYGMAEKTFIITGAMEPLRDKHGGWRPQADGWDNLRRAIKDARVEKPGVYVEMGARYEPNVGPGPWEADTVRKHVETQDDTPGTLVKHSEFQRDDPTRHQVLWQWER